MDLVDRDRRVALVAPPARIDPCPVAPVVVRRPRNARRGARRALGARGIGIGLERPEHAIGADDLVFVETAGVEAGDEELPHPGGVTQPHRTAPPVPVVEIADDADAARIGRPDGEGDAGDTFMLAAMRAQHVVTLQMRTLGEEVNVEIAQHRRKGVDVVEFDRAAIALGAQAIAKGRTPADRARPETILVDAGELARHLAGRGVDDPQPARPRQEDAHALSAAYGMHAEIGEGIAVTRLDQGAGAGAELSQRRCPPARAAR